MLFYNKTFFEMILITILLYSSIGWAQSYKTSKNAVCYGHPVVPSLSDASTCMGLVADKNIVAWKMPRKIVFVNSDLALVTDMGSWNKNEGQIWQLNFNKNIFFSAKKLFSNTDRTHDIKLGPDGYIYYGDATQIYRFDINNPTYTRKAVISLLPDSYTNSKGKTKPSSHPLTEFVFLKNGDLVVNVGAPSNDCTEEFKTERACYQRDVQAELRKYHYNPIKNNYDLNYDVIARGLRNSMGLLLNPIDNVIYQAENAADNPGTPDEINLINPNLLAKEQDFGWPFCSGVSNLYGPYQNFKSFCTNKAIPAFILEPAHSAPLDLIYYRGQMFPEYENAMMVSRHGHKPTGSRIAIYKTDSNMNPLHEYQTKYLSKLSPLQLISKSWQTSPNGSHPKGRPVGITYDNNGAIFIVDDANASLLVVAKFTGDATTLSDSDNLDTNSNNLTNKIQQEFKDLYEKELKGFNCQNCHNDVFSGDYKQVLNNLISNDWINLNSKNKKDQLLWRRLTGYNGTRIMPPAPATNMSRNLKTLSIIEKWIASF